MLKIKRRSNIIFCGVPRRRHFFIHLFAYISLLSICKEFVSLTVLLTIFSFPFNKVFASLTALSLLRIISLSDGVGLLLASPDMLYKERTPKTNLRGSQSGDATYSPYHRGPRKFLICAGEECPLDIRY